MHRVATHVSPKNVEHSAGSKTAQSDAILKAGETHKASGTSKSHSSGHKATHAKVSKTDGNTVFAELLQISLCTASQAPPSVLPEPAGGKPGDVKVSNAQLSKANGWKPEVGPSKAAVGMNPLAQALQQSTPAAGEQTKGVSAGPPVNQTPTASGRAEAVSTIQGFPSESETLPSATVAALAGQNQPPVNSKSASGVGNVPDVTKSNGEALAKSAASGTGLAFQEAVQSPLTSSVTDGPPAGTSDRMADGTTGKAAAHTVGEDGMLLDRTKHDTPMGDLSTSTAQWTAFAPVTSETIAPNGSLQPASPTVTFGDLKSLYDIAQTAVQQAGDGSQQLQVQVHPQGLGSLLISVTQTPQGLSIHVQANQMVTAQWLMGQSSDLQNQLQQQGLGVSGVGVSFGNTSPQSGGSDNSRRSRTAEMTVTRFQGRTAGISDLSDAMGAQHVQQRNWTGQGYNAWA